MLRHVLLLAGLAVVGLTGCDSRPKPQELGQEIFEVPAVPGADRPYQLPPEAGPVPKNPDG